MLNTGLLRAKINDRGIMLKHVAKKAGLSKQALWGKLNGVSEFKASQLAGIREALHLTDAEFMELFNAPAGV